MDRGSDIADGTENRSGYSWIVLAISFFNLFFGFGAFASYSVILPEMMREIGFSRGIGANILNAYYFSYICLSPAAGFLSDRFGARRIIALFWIVLGTGALLMGRAATAAQAALCFCLVGIGNSSSWTPGLALVQRWFSKGRKGLALGIFGAGIGLSFIVMGKAAPAIISRWSWRHCFLFLGSAQLAMALVNLLFMRNGPGDRGFRGLLKPVSATTAAAAPPRIGSSFKEFASTPRFWLIGLSYAAIAGALLSVTTFLVDYARNGLGFSMADASFLASVHGAGQIAGGVGILALSDATGRRNAIIASNLCIAACIAGILLAGPNRAILVACVAAFGAFYGAAFPMYGACGGDYFRREIMGTVIGMFTLFYGVGAISAGRAFGRLRDVSGSFSTPFAVAACLALASAALMIFVKKKPD